MISYGIHRLSRVLGARRGEGGAPSFGAIIAIIILAVAYLMQPDLFHSFVQWVIQSIFDALEQATGNEVDSPVNNGGDPKTITPPSNKGN